MTAFLELFFHLSSSLYKCHIGLVVGYWLTLWKALNEEQLRVYKTRIVEG